MSPCMAIGTKRWVRDSHVDLNLAKCTVETDDEKLGGGWTKDSLCDILFLEFGKTTKRMVHRCCQWDADRKAFWSMSRLAHRLAEFGHESFKVGLVGSIEIGTEPVVQENRRGSSHRRPNPAPPPPLFPHNDIIVPVEGDDTGRKKIRTSHSWQIVWTILPFSTCNY